MPDIFDQVAKEKPKAAKPDIFDQVTTPSGGPSEAQQLQAGLPGVPKPPLPIGLQPTTRVPQFGPGGVQFVDVPQTQAQQFQQANIQGVQTGAKIGATLAAAPSAIAAPAATAMSLGTGYIAGKGAKYGAKKLGAGQDIQDIAEGVGNVAGAVTGGLAAGAARQVIAGKIWTQLPNGTWEMDPWAEALSHPTKIGEAVLKQLAKKPETDLAMQDAYAAQRAVQRAAARNALVAREPLGPEALPPASPELFPGATPSNVPVGNAPLPSIQNPQGVPTPFGQPQIVSKFTPPEPSKVVLPGSPAPPVKVTYQSVPREQLYKMAKMGDIQAGLELIRNPKGFELPPNFKYLIEETAKRIPWRNLPE